jgi:hypothetical protein
MYPIKSNSWQASKIDTKHSKWVHSAQRGRRFESFRIQDDKYSKHAKFHAKIQVKEAKLEESTRNMCESKKFEVILGVALISSVVTKYL